MKGTNSSSTDFSTPPIWNEIKEYFGPISLHVGKTEGWRCRAKLAVRGTPSRPVIGIFRPGTHLVEDMGTCSDHHPSIEAAIEWVRRGIAKLQIIPLKEEGASGELRYLQFVVHRPTKKVQLTLVANGEASLPRIRELADYLWAEHQWHSIWSNVQGGVTNTIFGPHWHLEKGEEVLWEELHASDVAFHPACFSQAHLDLFEKVLEEIYLWALPGRKVAEYYAGVGVIGRTLGEKSPIVYLIEENPFAAASFALAETSPSYLYHTADAASCLVPVEEASLLVFDPPRKGVAADLLAACAAPHLEQILYLSCNFTTLKRDIEKLKAFGWIVEKASAYLLFPHTDHIEVLTSLKRAT